MVAERSRRKEQAAQTGALAITLYIVLMISRPHFIHDGNIQRERDTV